MRLRTIVLIVIMFQAVIAAHGDETLNPRKPGYQLGVVFANLGNSSYQKLVHDLDLVKERAKTRNEFDLATLAQDFLGCSILEGSTPDKCRLKGDLKRYGYYEPLANTLNESTKYNFNQIGGLFGCAVKQLQGLPHSAYEHCLSDFTPKK